MGKKKRVVPEGWFKWERPGIDFPFYNDNTVPTLHGWLLLGTSLLVAMVLNVAAVLPLDRNVIKFVMVFLIPLATLLYMARGDFGAIVKKPRWGDIPLVLIVTILGFILSVTMGVVLQSVLGMPMKGNAAVDETKDLGWFVLFFVQVFGEELFKASILLGCLVLAFRKTNSRKAGVAISSAVTLLVFGITHMATYGSLAQALLLQGLGSLPCVFAYLKTKNVLVAYASHTLFDLVSLGLTAVAIMAHGATAAAMMPLWQT